MHEHCPRPIILPMSNPTVLAEQTPDEPAGLDRRRRTGRHRQPVRTGRARRHDVPHRPGQQRADVPGPGAGRDRVPGRDHAAVAVHRRRPCSGEAGGSRPTRPRACCPTSRRLREVSATVAVDVINTATAAGIARVAGRRPDRGGPRGDVDTASTSRSSASHYGSPSTRHRSRAWPRPWRRSWSTRWSRSGSGRCTASSATRRTRSSTRCAGTRRTSSSCTSATRRPGRSRPGRTRRSPAVPTAVLGSSGPGSLHLRQRAVRLPAQRGARVRDRDPHPQHRDRQRLLPGDQPRGRSSRAARTTACWSPRPGQMPRVSELALQAAILERGVGMVILPGDVAAQKVEQPDAAPPDPHRPAGDPSGRRRARQGGAADRRRRRRSRSTAARGRGRRARRCSRLSDMLKAPVSYAYRGKDVLEADNPSGGRDDRAAGLGRSHRGAGRLRPAADARHRLPVPRVPPGREDDHPGRRQAAAPRTPGRGRPRPGRGRGGDAPGADPPARGPHRHARSSTRWSSTTTRW